MSKIIDITPKQQLACEYVISKARAGYDIYPDDSILEGCIKVIVTRVMKDVKTVSVPANRLNQLFEKDATIFAVYEDISDLSVEYIEYETKETTPQETLEWMGNNCDIDWLVERAYDLIDFARKQYPNENVDLYQVYDLWVEGELNG